MIGHIYIKGQIGSNEDSKGVELQDVVVQVESNKDAEALHIHIDSPGGSVNTGRLIADYISSLGNAFTIAENLCGSIATEIHLAVPIANRKIIAGTEYFVHNPLLVDVTGNADELASASAHVKQYEKEMVSMYTKATGADKAAIEGLMKAETSLTDEQCKSLGFVSEVLPRIESKLVAFMDLKTKKENKEKSISIDAMTKIKDIISQGFKDLRAELKIEPKEEVKAAMVVTDKGELSYASEGALPEVGEAVNVGGEPTGAGNYALEDGTVIVVGEDSIVAEIIPVEEVEANVEELQARIVELENDKVEMKAEFEQALNSEIEALKSQIGSTFEPKSEKKVFGKRGLKKEELSMKEKLKARKEELNEKKK